MTVMTETNAKLSRDAKFMSRQELEDELGQWVEHWKEHAPLLAEIERFHEVRATVEKIQKHLYWFETYRASHQEHEPEGDHVEDLT